MDYDFTQQDQAFFQGLSETLSSFIEGRNLERAEPPAAGDHVRSLLQRLSDTPYTRYGLESTPSALEGFHVLTAAMERVAAVSPSVCLSMEMSLRLFGRAIREWGTGEQQRTWLPGLFDGTTIGAVALSESAMNIDNDPFQTVGVLDGDAVVVNGEKNFVVNAPIADVTAVAGDFGGRTALFLIPAGTDGLYPGERMATLGYDGAAVSGLKLENCRIPAGRVIGPVEPSILRNTMRMWENQILCGISLGVMKSSFESARAYANEHRSGGKPIIAYQSVAFKLAEMLTLYQTSQLLAYRTVWTAENDPREAESLTWCAKVFCSESAEKVSSAALQILAGAGMVAGNPAERGYRCAKYGQIAGTSSEIARVRIGDDALGYR